MAKQTLFLLSLIVVQKKKTRISSFDTYLMFNPLNAELNSICHLLALLGAHHIFHVSGLRVKITLN